MKRTRNCVTNCDWKKCFSIRKFEWKFTSTAFTQEIESRIDFGLLKRVNGTCSMSILNNGQGILEVNCTVQIKCVDRNGNGTFFGVIN